MAVHGDINFLVKAINEGRAAHVCIDLLNSELYPCSKEFLENAISMFDKIINFTNKFSPYITTIHTQFGRNCYDTQNEYTFEEDEIEDMKAYDYDPVDLKLLPLERKIPKKKAPCLIDLANPNAEKDHVLFTQFPGIFLHEINGGLTKSGQNFKTFLERKSIDTLIISGTHNDECIPKNIDDALNRKFGTYNVYIIPDMVIAYENRTMLKEEDCKRSYSRLVNMLQSEEILSAIPRMKPRTFHPC